MKMQNAFGLLLLRLSEKLKMLAKSLGTMDTGLEDTVPTKSKTLIWCVMDGPYAREDFPEDEFEQYDIEENFNFMLVVKIEEDGKVGTANFWYETLDEALAVIKYFEQNIEPLEVNDGEEE